MAAPWIADLVGVVEVRTVLPVLGLATAISAVNALPFALLQKSLRFARLSSLEIFKSLVASAALLAFAASGFGFWSLVLNEVVAVVALAGALYWSTRYRLAFPRFSAIRQPLALSARVMISRLSWYAYSNADIAIVSRVLGKSVLGDYSMAYTLTNLPSQKIAATIMSVTTGVLSSVQSDAAELRRYFLRLAESLVIVLWPTTIGLALVAPLLVEVLLGAKWKGAIPIIQALAFAAAIRALGPVCSQVLLARLKANVEMRYTILSAVVLPIGFLVGSRYGATGVALAWSVLSPPIVALQLWVTASEIELPLGDLFAVLTRPAIAVTVMAVAVYSSHLLLVSREVPLAAELAIQVAVGALSYGAIIAATMKQRALAIIRLVRNR